MYRVKASVYKELEGRATVYFPTWWYDMSQALYSFFDAYDFSGTIEIIQDLEPQAEVITDGFTVSERDVAKAAEDVADWLRGLGY